MAWMQYTNGKNGFDELKIEAQSAIIFICHYLDCFFEAPWDR